MTVRGSTSGVQSRRSQSVRHGPGPQTAHRHPDLPDDRDGVQPRGTQPRGVHGGTRV